MEERTHKQALPAGTRLQNYRVVGVLGVGGFGVTYLAEHVTLGQKAAIKEYLPNEFAVRDGATVHAKSEGDRADFEWGLQRFLDEARTLARFEHRNVVRVRDYFEANRTAYIVMDYEEGEPLDKLLESHGTLTEAQLRRVLLPIVEGLLEVHAAGFLHRDIKPSNVFVRRSDESPVLLDFGAARQALGRKSKSLTSVASAGYSPPEQYESEGEQGPWTDIYSLSALCYRAITGSAPVEAPRRQSGLLRSGRDPLPRLAETAPGDCSDALLEAVDWGLRVIETERPQSLVEWATALSGESLLESTSGEPQAWRPIQADRESAHQLAWPPQRNRAPIWVGVIGALAVAVAAVWVAEPRRRTTPRRRTRCSSGENRFGRTRAGTPERFTPNVSARRGNGYSGGGDGAGRCRCVGRRYARRANAAASEDSPTRILSGDSAPPGLPKRHY